MSLFMPKLSFLEEDREVVEVEEGVGVDPLLGESCLGLSPESLLRIVARVNGGLIWLEVGSRLMRIVGPLSSLILGRMETS